MVIACSAFARQTHTHRILHICLNLIVSVIQMLATSHYFFSSASSSAVRSSIYFDRLFYFAFFSLFLYFAFDFHTKSLSQIRYVRCCVVSTDNKKAHPPKPEIVSIHKLDSRDANCIHTADLVCWMPTTL